MKKLTLLFFASILGAILYYNFSEKNPSSISLLKSDPLSIKEQILQKALPKDILSNKTYKAFISPNLTPKDFLNNSDVNKEDSKEFLDKSFATLKECFLDGCGEQPDQDGNYEAALTVATKSLIDILEIADNNPENLQIKQWLKSEDLLKMLYSENQDLRKAALKNIFNILSPEEAFSTILDFGRELEGYSVGNIIQELKPLLNEDNTQNFVDQIELLNKEKSSFSAIEILKNMENTNLDLQQIEQIATPLCRFVNAEHQQHNVNALNYYLTKVSKDHQTSLNSLCR